MVFLIVLGVGVFAFLFLLISNAISNRKLKDAFSRNNVIVFGKKGTGKDLIFQHVINIRKKPYHANISYGGNYKHATPKDLNLDPNDYEKLIDGKITILDKKKYPFENEDFYFSDLGIILPSQYDNLLHKKFKTFPVAYALSRHLWHNNIHGNTQNLERIWKALREQADTYIKCNHTLNLPFFLVVSFTMYDKYASAKAELNPLGARLWNALSKVEQDKYIALNGNIEKRFVLIPKKKITYDTRAYHKILFGVEAPKKSRKKDAGDVPVER